MLNYILISSLIKIGINYGNIKESLELVTW